MARKHFFPTLRERLDAVNRLIKRSASGSLMSDSKWRKLFQAIDDAGIDVRWCTIKFVGVEEPRKMHWGFGLYPPRPWIDTGDGPIELRSIEWLEIPAIAPYPPRNGLDVSRKAQDLDGVKEILEGLGQYPLIEEPDRLRIIGHTMRQE